MGLGTKIGTRNQDRDQEQDVGLGPGPESPGGILGGTGGIQVGQVGTWDQVELNTTPNRPTLGIPD